jgi:hypothetical protein
VGGSAGDSIPIDVTAEERGDELLREIIQYARIIAVEIRWDPPGDQGLAEGLIPKIALPSHDAAAAELAPHVPRHEVRREGGDAVGILLA